MHVGQVTAPSVSLCTASEKIGGNYARLAAFLGLMKNAPKHEQLMQGMERGGDHEHYGEHQ